MGVEFSVTLEKVTLLISLVIAVLGLTKITLEVIHNYKRFFRPEHRPKSDLVIIPTAKEIGLYGQSLGKPKPVQRISFQYIQSLKFKSRVFAVMIAFVWVFVIVIVRLFYFAGWSDGASGLN